MSDNKPRANHPLCWLCNRRLYAGGRRWISFLGDDGHEHPVHASCALRELRRNAADAMRGAAEEYTRGSSK